MHRLRSPGILALLLLILAGAGCHRRYNRAPAAPAEGVRVRAPFVDVQVPTGRPDRPGVMIEEPDLRDIEED